MGRTLIVYFGNLAKPSAGRKRVRQFAEGLRSAGDDACVLGCIRGAVRPGPQGVTGPSAPYSSAKWFNDAWGIQCYAVSVAPGLLSPAGVLDAMQISGRLAAAVSGAVQERGFRRVVLYGQSWFGLRRVVNTVKSLKLPMVADLNEWWQWRIGPPSMLRVCLDRWLFSLRCMPQMSGLVGVSSFWRGYAARLGRPMILVPTMADESAPPTRMRGDHSVRLVYVGMLHRRDLPETLLQGVRRALQNGCRVQMMVVGSTHVWAEARRAASTIARDPLLRGAVEIAGWVDAERLQRIYSDATAFVLLREDDRESRACFPTRLPEYLATGRPVITSLVGDVGCLLEDGRSAWLLPPGRHPEHLARALCDVAANPVKAEKIGAMGRTVAAENLSVAAHGRRLTEFLGSLDQAHEAADVGTPHA